MWIEYFEKESCLDQLMWILENALNDSLLLYSFNFIDSLLTINVSSTKALLKLNFLDLLVYVFNSYVVKQSGLC